MNDVITVAEMTVAVYFIVINVTTIKGRSRIRPAVMLVAMLAINVTTRLVLSSDNPIETTVTVALWLQAVVAGTFFAIKD